MAERGHSCPQQRASYEIGSKSKRLRLSEIAADKNVRAPPAVTDRLRERSVLARFCKMALVESSAPIGKLVMNAIRCKAGGRACLVGILFFLAASAFAGPGQLVSLLDSNREPPAGGN